MRERNGNTRPFVYQREDDAIPAIVANVLVGSFPRGRAPFGLDDMAGNVWDWTSSWFPGAPDKRVTRGGGLGNNPYCL